MKYTTILWDIDGTILNFLKAENAAMKKCFDIIGLGQCTDEMIERYSAINKIYWQRLERGEITKSQVLVGRFREFFEREGIDVSKAEAFNNEYQVRLGDTVVFNDDALEIIKSLKEQGYLQYVITNGTKIAQDRKLDASHLRELMDGVFISEEVGAEKPAKFFFDKVLESVVEKERSKMLVVGDSLTSDIRGANNAKIDCCWYNPTHSDNDIEVDVDYIIDNLHQIVDVLN